MRQLKNIQELNDAILELEQLQAMQKNELKEQFEVTKQSLKPVNIIKSTFRDLKNDSQVQESVLQGAAGLGLGILSKGLFVGKSASLIKNFIGGALESVVKNVSANNTVQAYAKAIYKNLFKKKEEV